jgi:hypothetical protein
MVAGAFLTTTTNAAPQDGRTDSDDGKQVSDFITVQSFTNLSAVTGAITAAWKALELTSWHWTTSRTVPLVACLVFGGVSVLVSKLDGWRAVMPAAFVALINSLVLFGAVIGATIALKAS